MPTEVVAISPDVMRIIECLAQEQGRTVDDVASELIAQAFAQAVQQFTGHRRARIYTPAARAAKVH